MKISQVKELVTKMFEEDDSLKYAIATNIAKYGRPDSRPGDKKAKLTKSLEKKREKHVLDLKKSMKEDKPGTYAGRPVVVHMDGPETEWKVKFVNSGKVVDYIDLMANLKFDDGTDYQDYLSENKEDDEGSAFPGESPSRGYMEARKLIDQLRATTFKKLNDDELYDFRKTIATAFDMSLRESEVSHGGQKGGAPIDLSEDINDDLKKIAKSLESQFDDLRFDVNYNKYNPENSRIDVRGTQQDMMNFGNKLQGKKFGEYEVFAIDDDDRGEIVQIVKSDTISRSEGKKKKNPSMGIVRKKLGKVPKAGKVAYQKKMKLPTGLVNYMDYTVSEKKKKKDDRCTRIAKRKYDTWPSAYASGAVVRCRKGEIWKGVK